MTDDLQRLEDWAGPLLRQLQPAQRTRLSRAIGTALRRSQQKRIAAQQNPDGSPYAPRRPATPRRAKAGSIKRRAMFAKIRQAKHLRIRATPQDVTVGFMGRVTRIAQVHQEGRTDSVSRGGPRVTYARRELLGFSAADEQLVHELILDHLGNQTL
ncbi:phage virion morphogenesis protein [Stenotrophomonas sp. Iso1]|uniref:phage virion morphogenesis protein n=1 Tax=Stenotrophomonas sp. Iso1 TaxID=2977283 RepID=UPI0022B79E2A|nr:phage virion morphogenesis protein [Stenotrophomonas sp. Iso1]